MTNVISLNPNIVEDGLIVMRGQPLHIGHTRLITTALNNCTRVFIVLGSTQEFGTSRNPFTYAERKKMLKNYFTRYVDVLDDGEEFELWNRVVVIGLPDIFSLRWPRYVLDEISKSVPDANITKVFGGSQYDCDWFKDHKLKPYIVDRTDQENSYASASMVRDMLTYGDPRWTHYVPPCNWRIVAKKFNRLDMIPTREEEEDDSFNT
jgi:nicotinamide mononucleotide adenylyltransferase